MVLDSETGMEESDRQPFTVDRRDHMRRKLVRFDPTVSTGTLLQVIGFLLAAATAWGTYTADRTQTRADIDAVKHDTESTRAQLSQAIKEFREDMRDTRNAVQDTNVSVAAMKAQLTTMQQKSSK